MDRADDLAGALYLRDRLSDALSDTPEPVKTVALRFIDAADQHFLRITDEDPHGSLRPPGAPEHSDLGWWWYRVPKDGPIRSQLERLHGDTE